MRRYLGVLLVMCFVGGSVYGSPRERPREDPPALKIVKRLVKSLGDGIIIPIPPPKP